MDLWELVLLSLLVLHLLMHSILLQSGKWAGEQVDCRLPLRRIYFVLLPLDLKLSQIMSWQKDFERLRQKGFQRGKL